MATNTNTAAISGSGQEMIERIVAMRQSPEYTTYLLMQSRAYPDDSQVESLDVTNLRKLLSERVSSIEQRLTEVAQAINMTAQKGESPQARHYRESAKNIALKSAETTAVCSNNPHELDYAAQMFMEVRPVIVKLAQNPFIEEKTIERLLNHPIYKGDATIGRALAANHAITPNTANQIAKQFPGNRFVMHALSENVSNHAHVAPNRREFAKVCKDITAIHPVDFPTAPAIKGVDDPDHLRALYNQHNSRSAIERNLDHATFHAIAQNPHTPTDVIARMSDQQPLTSLVGKEAVTTNEIIARRMAEDRQRRMPVARAEAESPWPM